MQKYHSKYQPSKRLVLALFLIFIGYLFTNYFGLSENVSKILVSKLNNRLTHPFISNNAKIDTINTLNCTLKWYKVVGAKKYQVMIKEYEKKLDEEFLTIIRTFEVEDTFFVIPTPTLKDGNYYVWNVCSFDGKNWGRFGENVFFMVNLKSSKALDKKTIPIMLSPGKFAPEFEIINTLTPEFKWCSVKDAIGYELILLEKTKDKSYRKIFSTENHGLINDTSFFLKSNLLKSNIVYGWYLKVYTKLDYVYQTDTIYFKIALPEQIIPPEVLYPGYKIEEKEVIATTTPTFVWRKFPGAKSYSLVICKRDQLGEYNLIFDSEKLYTIKDTIFQLPPGILENNSAYSWNVKVHLKNYKSIYSEKLYFKVNIVEPTKLEITKPRVDYSNEEIEEIFLNLEYADVVKTFIQAISFDNKIFVSFNEFLDNVQISYRIKNNIVYESELLDTSYFFIVDFEKLKAKTHSKEFKINTTDFAQHSGQFFISTEILEKLFSIKINFDFSNLTLTVTSDRLLPVYNRFILEKKYATLKKLQQEKQYILLFPRKRSLINGFILDYNISQTLLQNYIPSYFFNIGFGGELLYGDFYYSQQRFLSESFNSSIENFNWKYTPNPNNYITQLSLGDALVEGLNVYTYRGISITNEPVEPRKKLGTYIYQDVVDPNSLVELYFNNELIDITRSDANGNYTFEIPLKYGMSILEFRIHSIRGDTKIRRKLFQIPYDIIPARALNYRLSAGKLHFTQNRFLNFDTKYGATDYLTLNTGAEFITDTSGKFLNFYGAAALRPISNLSLNLFYSPKIYSKVFASYVQPDYSSLFVEYINYKRNKYYNVTNMFSSLKGYFYLPVRFKGHDLGLYVNSESYKAETFKRKVLKFIGHIHYDWLSLSSGLNFDHYDYGNSIKRQEAIFGSTINLNHFFKNIPVLNRSLLNSRIAFDLIDKKIFNYSIFYSTTVANKLRFQINYENIIKTNTANLNLSLFIDLPQYNYTANSNGKDIYYHQFSGSVGYSPELNLFYLYREPQIGRSAIYIEGFEDRNSNAIKEYEEENLKGLDFKINSAAYSINLKNNAKIICGLNPYNEYTIETNESNLKSLNYSFEFSEFRVITDGNRLKVLQLPYYETGEIGGIVFRFYENDTITVWNAKLKITNLLTGKEIEIFTFSDGSFYYYGLPKGKYVIEIDKQFLQKLNLKSIPEKIEFEIDPVKNKIVIEDLKFIIE